MRCGWRAGLVVVAALAACGEPALEPAGGDASAASDGGGDAGVLGDAPSGDADASADGATDPDAVADADAEHDDGDALDGTTGDAIADSGLNGDLDSDLDSDLDGALDGTADSSAAGDGLADDASDGGADAASAGDADAGADANGDATCEAQTPFSYACNMAQPASCPGGVCALSFCLGPKLDPDRWKTCGDGSCGACETAAGCPADCGAPPPLAGAKDHSGATTVTVWVHGFTNKKADEIKKQTYGATKGCGDLLENMSKFGVNRPCGAGAVVDASPQHMISVEYFGAVAPTWMTAQDVKDVEAFPYDQGADGLERYARIVAKFARWRMEVSKATHVQFACHSMGCLITRHLIERDLEKLASQQKIVRWATNTGVIAGARLARLYDNPAVQQGATAIGLELSDFVLMNPDHVMDTTAAWDHKPWLGNNPLLQGIWIHHTVATNPKIAQALNIQLLDLNNPGDEPNDGIMFTLDQYFHAQGPLGVSMAKAGVAVPATRSYAYFDHMANPEALASAAMAAAALFHMRKVRVVLEEVELYDDLEADGPLDFKNQGQAPAEVACEVAVRYNPWLKNTFGLDVLLSEQRVAHRSAEVVVASQGQVAKPELVLFAGPVFDGQPSLHLQAWLLEADWYPRFGVQEWPLDPHELLVAIDQVVELKDHSFEVKSKTARAKVRVEVVAM